MSEKINKLSCDTARLLYTWMLAHLDVNGCYYADPVIVKNTIFPWREDIKADMVSKWLDEMDELNLIKRYNSAGHYLIYPDFEDKQPKIQRDREGKTDIPPPTEEQLLSNSCVTPTQIKLKEVKVKEDKVPTEVETFLSELLKTKILENNPKARVKENGWWKDVGLMISDDKRTPEEIKQIIIFSQKDDFWKCNILSMGKLRKQFDRLTLKAKGKNEAISRGTDVKSDLDKAFKGRTN